MEDIDLGFKVCSEIEMFCCSNYNWLVEILVETGTWYSSSSDDDYFPIVEEILYPIL